VLAYVTVTGGPQTLDYAARFAASYHANPPGIDHETLIICNGGPAQAAVGVSLMSLPRPIFFARANDGGWDISAYMEAAKGPAAGADLMLCFGQSIFFHRAGWLERIVSSWQKYGPGIYGAFASNTVRPHINTTGFCTSADLLSRYPYTVKDKDTRYEFEHGLKSFWRILRQSGRPAMLVTWDGEYPPERWRHPSNILWRGNQTNCLFYCQHTERYEAADQETRAGWHKQCDQPYTP
jgi:hypothetical protein